MPDDDQATKPPSLMDTAIAEIDARYGKHFGINHLELVHAIMVCAMLNRLIGVATRALDQLEANRLEGNE